MSVRVCYNALIAQRISLLGALVNHPENDGERLPKKDNLVFRKTPYSKVEAYKEVAITSEEVYFLSRRLDFNCMKYLIQLQRKP